jgi:5-hydroxyisourate hydrolase
VISTHILDTVSGEPARQVAVRLERHDAGGWRPAGAGRTDDDGRWKFPAEIPAGGYRLVFDVRAHLGEDAFFPEITVAFNVAETDRNYHVPLLLSRYGYTTYRGS